MFILKSPDTKNLHVVDIELKVPLTDDGDTDHQCQEWDSCIID